MYLTLQSADLGAALASATAAAGKARMVRLAARESVAIITGNDATMSVSMEVPASIEAEGEVVLNADRIAGIAGHASGDMTLSATDTSAGITCGDGKYRLLVLSNPPAALVLDDEVASIAITAQDLRHLLEPIAAAGREASRYYLNGICLLSEADCLSSTATDGVRLLRTTIAAPEFTTDRHLVIPTRSVLAIEKLTRRNTGMLTLRRNRRLVEVSGPGFTLVSKLIDVRYPDLTSVLPAATGDAATFRRQDLADSLARLMAAMDGEAPLLAIEWHAPGQVFLYLARQPENSDLVDATTEGDAQIAVALAPLAMLLGEFSSAQLRLEVTNRLAIRSADKLGVVASSQWNFEPRAPSGARRTRSTGKGAGKQKENANENV
jgi:DNA polymerase III sliding clamp (beta) subunit (PCNA family)